MENEDLLAWGKRFHYPRIVLYRNPHDILKAGESAWQEFLEQRDPVRLKLLKERKEHWENSSYQHGKEN